MIKITVVLCSLIMWISSVAMAQVPIIPVSEIPTGMKGYAKTVISGDDIETFDIEVLVGTGRESTGSQILVKASGDVFHRSGGVSH